MLACGTKRTLILTTAGDKCCVMRPDFRCSFFDRFMFIKQILQVLWILPLSQETGEGFPPHDITSASYAELCCQLSSFVSGIISKPPWLSEMISSMYTWRGATGPLICLGGMSKLIVETSQDTELHISYHCCSIWRHRLGCLKGRHKTLCLRGVQYVVASLVTELGRNFVGESHRTGSLSQGDTSTVEPDYDTKVIQTSANVVLIVVLNAIDKY